jgi:hypothetical protein
MNSGSVPNWRCERRCSAAEIGGKFWDEYQLIKSMAEVWDDARHLAAQNHPEKYLQGALSRDPASKADQHSAPAGLGVYRIALPLPFL